MEVVHHHHHQGRRRICREMSTSPPDQKRGTTTSKARVQHHQARAVVRPPSFKKVQVVYYLSRNGHLEHPHYVELTHLAHQPLLLKDFMDKLTMLRGKGMPSLYSWSCKRNYKNGYVWNDVGENDVIYPSEGAEYVLKGSELIEGCTEKLNHLQVNNGEQMLPITNRQSGPDANFQPKRSPIASTRRPELEEMANHFRDDEGKVEEEQEFEYEEKTGYASGATPPSRRSRGVSTDEIQEFKQQENPKNTLVELNSYSSPPSTTSSTSLSDKAINETTSNNNVSKRFEDGDTVGSEPLLSRNSMLLSLIACGGSGSFRKSVPPPSPPPRVAARKSVSGGSLHKGVVCKAAAGKVAVEEDEETMIGYMSENPRFGNLQAEEKEYFSGSIVESMTNEDRLAMNEPSGLKKSSSYNEERSSQAGLEEAAAAAAEKEVKKEKGAKGKCIPRIMF